MFGDILVPEPTLTMCPGSAGTWQGRLAVAFEIAGSISTASLYQFRATRRRWVPVSGCHFVCNGLEPRCCRPVLFFMVQQPTGPNTVTLYNRNGRFKSYPISYPLGRNTPFDNLNKISKPNFNWELFIFGFGQVTLYIPNIEGITIHSNINDLRYISLN